MQKNVLLISIMIVMLTTKASSIHKPLERSNKINHLAINSNSTFKKENHKFNLRNKYVIHMSLLHRAAAELKNVLKKKTLTSATKSFILHKIFDSKGDPRKDLLAREIFREAMTPSYPTNGVTGDLGAELLKLSVYSKNNFISNKASKKSFRSFRNLTRVNSNSFAKIDPYVVPYVVSHLSRRKIEQQIRHKLKEVLRKQHTSPGLQKKLSGLLKNNRTLLKSKKGIEFYEIKNTPMRKIHKPKYLTNKKISNSGIAIKTSNKDKNQKTIISVKSNKLENNSKIIDKQRHLDKQRQRKDFVIELDDDNDEQRDFDPILSLIERYAESHNHDFSVVDEDENNDELKDIEDGFVTAKRRKFGENLFFNSFNEQEKDEEEEEMLNNRFNNLIGPSDQIAGDQFYSNRELGMLNDEEATEYENPPIYDDITDSDVAFEKSEEEKRRRSRV
ncbi:uncharacterized protein LOC124812786 isoform X1 [Hydra vulgaris]|uniref:uncharacterized protein LOC124812786 isoform X1 n=1 Tax=Hydra vulgaris TaxID=6087 RepID=UPI001F5E4D3C|nr:uncharacterized protein LOC124812786 [Hydra vulgaris]